MFHRKAITTWEIVISSWTAELNQCNDVAAAKKSHILKNIVANNDDLPSI